MILTELFYNITEIERFENVKVIGVHFDKLIVFASSYNKNMSKILESE